MNITNEALGYCGWLRGMIAPETKTAEVQEDIRSFDAWYISATVHHCGGDIIYDVEDGKVIRRCTKCKANVEYREEV